MIKDKILIITCSVILFICGLFLYYKNRNKVIKSQVNPIDSAEMVWVPAGYFTMGNNDGGNDHAAPQHKVYLDGYWIYRYEVTVKQYRLFCNATNRKMPINLPKWGNQDNFPMVLVSWEDAVSYAKWAGCTLPTEAEWEKAARGADGRQLPWGSWWDAKKCVNSFEYDIPNPLPVGSLHTGDSPYGASDMAGNVSEWCLDWFSSSYYNKTSNKNPPVAYYEISPEKNPQGPNQGAFKVIRGGAWCDRASGCIISEPTYFKTYYRSQYENISFKTSNIGFRCVKH